MQFLKRQIHIGLSFCEETYSAPQEWLITTISIFFPHTAQHFLCGFLLSSKQHRPAFFTSKSTSLFESRSLSACLYYTFTLFLFFLVGLFFYSKPSSVLFYAAVKTKMYKNCFCVCLLRLAQYTFVFITCLGSHDEVEFGVWSAISSVGVMLAYGVDGPGLNSQWGILYSGCFGEFFRLSTHFGIRDER